MLAASTLSSPTPTPTPTPDSGTAGRLLAAAVHVRRRLDTIARAGHRVDDTAADLAAYLRLVDGALLALARSPSDDSTLLALAARHSAVTAVLRAGAARQPSLTLQLIAYCMEHVERGVRRMHTRECLFQVVHVDALNVHLSPRLHVHAVPLPTLFHFPCSAPACATHRRL